jgi:hypothetical protein
MAITIMHGLFVATFLTLLFLPSLYALWYRKRLDERGHVGGHLGDHLGGASPADERRERVVPLAIAPNDNVPAAVAAGCWIRQKKRKRPLCLRLM